MSRAALGVKAPMLLKSGFVADWPTMPAIETSASEAGKIERMLW